MGLPVQQLDNVTPGHLVIWRAPGVIGDGGALAAPKLITSIRQADFNDTNDQPLIIPDTTTAFQLTGILITNVSANLSLAVGGFYPQASKAGTAIVAASQVYSALTVKNKILAATLAGAAGTTRFSVTELPDWVIYLSLTTPQGSPATADVYILGVDLT